MEMQQNQSLSDDAEVAYFSDVCQLLQLARVLFSPLNYSRRVFSIASNDIEPGLIPSGAFDTHVHVFDPKLGLYHPSRAYTPAEAPLFNLLEFLSSLNKAQKPTNIVLVQPSPYKADNRVLLAALDQLRADPVIKARGIAVVDLESISDTELTNLHSAGIRGLRLNLQSDGHVIDIEVVKKNMQKAADLIRDLPGWMLQIFGGAAIWESKCFFLSFFSLFFAMPDAPLG